jgi:hypothetical protein
VAGQGAGLAVGVGGGDDHPVEQGGQAGGVDDANVLALDVFEGGNDEGFEVLDVH